MDIRVQEDYIQYQFQNMPRHSQEICPIWKNQAGLEKINKNIYFIY